MASQNEHMVIKESLLFYRGGLTHSSLNHDRWWGFAAGEKIRRWTCTSIPLTNDFYCWSKCDALLWFFLLSSTRACIRRHGFLPHSHSDWSKLGSTKFRFILFSDGWRCWTCSCVWTICTSLVSVVWFISLCTHWCFSKTAADRYIWVSTFLSISPYINIFHDKTLKSAFSPNQILSFGP